MKPLILVTNDDGILSPGLVAAADAVANLGDLLVVAPQFQQTSMSRAYPRTGDAGIIETVILMIAGKRVQAYGVQGSPALVVSHAILEIAPRKPDLCICGINYGENVGLSILGSGTIGAALEADSYGVPAIAVSLESGLDTHHSPSYNALDWTSAQYFTNHLATRVLREGLPKEIAVLNVNIPSTATSSTPIRRTKQSRQNYFVFAKPQEREFAKAFLFDVEVRIDRSTLEPDSDISALIIDRVVSVTPLGWDLTAATDWGLETD